MRRALAVALAVLMGAGAVSAQSLSELAAKEKERRKKAKAAPTFTDEDLKKARPGAAPLPADQIAEPSGGRERNDEDYDAPPDLPAASSPDAEEAWRGAVQQRREAIENAEKAVVEAQARLAATRSSVGQPQQADGLRQVPLSPLLKEADYEAAEKAVTDAKAAVDAAKRALSALEERARKSSIPPGWLR